MLTFSGSGRPLPLAACIIRFQQLDTRRSISSGPALAELLSLMLIERGIGLIGSPDAPASFRGATS